MVLVSVIVPVYNVEQYLERCVESIRNQTLKEIEIILVDDGSPDECPRLCDEYAELDERIKVIHKKNGGLSSARNAGIQNSRGKYIGFIDSDDYIESNMYEKLYEAAESNNVDMVMADCWKVTNQKKILKTCEIRSGLYNNEDLEKEIYPKLIMRNSIEFGPILSVWNCLYKREILQENKLFFDEEILWSEDCIFSALCVYSISSFLYLKGEPLYNYMYNPQSISNTYKEKSWDVYRKMNEKLRNKFEGVQGYDFVNQLDFHMIYFACNSMQQLRFSDYKFWKKYKIRKSILLDLKKSNVKIDLHKINVNWKFKINLWLIKYKMAFLLTCISYKK